MGENDRLTIPEAAALCGLTARTLRKHVRSGRLTTSDGADGKPTASVADLKKAGLLGESEAPADEPKTEEERHVTNVETMPAAQAGSWMSADSGDLLRRLLEEREAAASAWKEQTENLYRELIRDQRERVERLEAENRELTGQLHGALQKIPKLLELEKVEQEARGATERAAKATDRAEDAETEARKLNERLERLEADLERSESQGEELRTTVAGLRSRKLWDRVFGTEPQPSSD